ncbi:hypothetical protein BJV74DRAFT_951475 [Russula compacta]|nr:hypothetical protein BJV74DRAFT_951475 [Russula compacta]
MLVVLPSIQRHHHCLYYARLMPKDIPPLYIPKRGCIRELSGRVAHLLETCKNRALFASEELWWKRTRACIETTVSLACCANAQIDWFGDIVKLLGDIGRDQTIRESSLMGKDPLFVIRWTCLSLIAIRPILEHDTSLHLAARNALEWLELEKDLGHGQALTVLETLREAGNCLWSLSVALEREEDSTEAKEILRSHEFTISQLEQFGIQADRFGKVDEEIFYVQTHIDEKFYFDETIKLFRDSLKLQFILPRQNLRSICSFAPISGDFLKTIPCRCRPRVLWQLQAFRQAASGYLEGHLLERQLWRLQDLCDGGGLGYVVELFFLALKQLLSTSSPSETHSTLYIGTFRAITANWSKYKHSLGTQKLLLHMAASSCGIISESDFPAYITDELLVLLGNVFDGQIGLHIDEVVQKLSARRAARRTHTATKYDIFCSKALVVISRERAAAL